MNLRRAALSTFYVSALYIMSLASGGYAHAQATESAAQNHAQIRIFPEVNRISAGQTLEIGINQTLDEGWHTYWINPGDSGTPLEISWTLPEGFSAGEIEWPTPHKVPFGPLMNYGYEKQATLLQTLRAPQTLPTGPITLKADVTVLVCKDICIPESSSHEVILNEGKHTDQSAAISAAREHMPQQIDWAATYKEDTTGEKPTLSLTVSVTPADKLAGVDPQSISLLPYEWGLIENMATPVTALSADNILTLAQQRGARPLSEINNLRAVLTYIDAEGKHRGLDISAQPDPQWLAAAQPADAQQKTEEAAAKAEAVPSIPAAAATNPAPMALMTALLFAVLGGMILNLMPCVFPVLSLKAISLSQMAEKEQSHAALYGMVYTAGVVLSFVLIAAILMVLKSAGAQIGWGFQLQNPVAVYGLSLLLFVIGLNLSGVFEIRTSFSGAGQKLTQSNSLSGAFFTGVLATLVATPCTAPFMGAAMGFALTHPPLTGILVFVALGFGLALPYLLLTVVPPLRRALPRPGHWMETFKEFLAFPMYASAAWLLWVFAQQTGSMGVLGGLFGMISIAFALWAWRHRPDHHPVIRLLVTILIIVIMTAGLIGSFGIAVHHERRSNDTPETALADASPNQEWEAYSTAGFEEWYKGDEPIFVNMTAAWCITCKVNEKIALSIPETHALFTKKGIVALKGDWTNQNPEITKFLESHGRKGVPLYVYYGPRDPGTGERPAPVVLPQLLTPSIVAETVSK
jgi:thiol:disulfide interchange protein/DsbC/DsbD-like thiol-disulfide interchange protein